VERSAGPSSTRGLPKRSWPAEVLGRRMRPAQEALRVLPSRVVASGTVTNEEAACP
jgi:hypothetical protein